jgi:hypothetical protein
MQTVLNLEELDAGIAFWRSRRLWPADFHNDLYAVLAAANPHGDFTLEWWRAFLKRLQAWKATRPFTGDVLTARFVESAPALSEAWSSCEPLLTQDISTVPWARVAAFADEVATIKPTRSPSPVFTSKFCHFLAPAIFPVVDNEGLGNAWRTYEQYFECVQDEWAATDASVRDAMAAKLTALVEAVGESVVTAYPMTNKIVELCLMGRHHLARARPT